MPPTTWLDPDKYLNYLLITSKNGDTLVYEKPINNKNWSTEEFNPFPDGAFASKNYTYIFKQAKSIGSSKLPILKKYHQNFV